ncbi:MAG TPA: hypothetical protein VLC72_00765 [Nitrosopumilaceae archaeon]|nr:hypothetical protein [Nitrosopumilaceae archaeon]
MSIQDYPLWGFTKFDEANSVKTRTVETQTIYGINLDSNLRVLY